MLRNKIEFRSAKRLSARASLLIAFTCVVVSAAVAQIDAEPAATKQLLTFPIFTLEVPKDTKFVRTASIDSQGWSYEHRDFVLRVELSTYASIPPGITVAPGYSEKIEKIGSLYGRLCSYTLPVYQGGSDYFAYEAYFSFENKSTYLSLKFLSANKDIFQIGERIVRTARFDSQKIALLR